MVNVDGAVRPSHAMSPRSTQPIYDPSCQQKNAWNARPSITIVIHWTYRCFPFIQEHLLLGLLLRVVVVIFYSLIINSDAQIGSTQLQSIIRRQRRHQQHNAADSFSERPMRLFPMISDKDVRWCVAVHSAVWRRKWAE